MSFCSSFVSTVVLLIFQENANQYFLKVNASCINELKCPGMTFFSSWFCRGDPLFLEPFWMQHAASSALVVAGWHRMSYVFENNSYISHELEKHIRRLHSIAKNAATSGKYIVFGAGSTQLLNAAVYALSPQNSSSPAKVVASIPYYPVCFFLSWFGCLRLLLCLFRHKAFYWERCLCWKYFPEKRIP